MLLHHYILKYKHVVIKMACDVDSASEMLCSCHGNMIIEIIA